MKLLDGRHRWGPIVQKGARLSRTCMACGRTDEYEVLIPNSLVEALNDYIRQPNPYRSMFR